MTRSSPEWLTLTAASRLLGVHPITLRAWVDAGVVRAFRTPGRHRRFQVNDLRAFLEQRRADSASRALTVAPDQTLQQIREQLGAEPVQHSTWYLRLTDAQRAKHRETGQRLLGLLLQFVSRQENAQHFLAEAQTLACEYGRELAGANLSATELARAFLFFRRAVVNATYHPENTSVQGDAEGVRLLQRINTFMDELLLATLEAYEAFVSTASAPRAKALRRKSKKTAMRLAKRLQK